MRAPVLSVAERYRNRAITDIFEPGSSIKPLIVAAALESGQYRPSSVVDTAPGFVIVGAKKIEDSRNLGQISLTTILARSSNVGVTKLAMTLQPDQLWETMTEFGLGEMTSSGFPGESAGMLSHYSNWRPISQATIAYGYGVSVTPLQLAQAYAAIGNDGIMQPISLFAIDEPAKGEHVISDETAHAVRRMLEEVVRPGGTGTKASIDGYRVAGKTGTAWKFAKGGYSKDKYISIFAGLAPASDPRLATVVVIDEPSGELYYGSDVAAPVFADVMAESLRLLAVPPDAMPARDPGNAAMKLNPAPTLAELLSAYAVAPEIPVAGIASDSRQLGHGFLFLACEGATCHGLDFLQQARDAGACAVAWDSSTAAEPDDIGIPMIAVANLAENLGDIANRFYGNPSSHLKTIGVTGTNGKTTVAWLIAECLRSARWALAWMICKWQKV